jgi:hypothetical protein
VKGCRAWAAPVSRPRAPGHVILAKAGIHWAWQRASKPIQFPCRAKVRLDTRLRGYDGVLSTKWWRAWAAPVIGPAIPTSSSSRRRGSIGPGRGHLSLFKFRVEPESAWIPAFAGMTGCMSTHDRRHGHHCQDACSFQQKNLDPNTTPAPTLIRLQLAACSLQLAACSLQLAACSLQLAAYLLLQTTAHSKQSGWLGLML